jgi:hypothetical protein
MSTVVKSKTPSSYSSRSSRISSSDRQSEILLKSPSSKYRDRARAVSPGWQNSQVPLTPGQRNRHQETGKTLSNPKLETPTWLKFLMTVQRGSTPITFLLVIGVLIVYGWSVYSQRAWSKAYGQLAQLQREERQLTATSEARKFQLAEQAKSSTTGLVRRDPANIIFLKPEPSRSQRPNSTQPTKGPAPVSPVGY